MGQVREPRLPPDDLSAFRNIFAPILIVFECSHELDVPEMIQIEEIKRINLNKF